MNDKKIQEFIKENESLFWWIKKEERKNISINLLVEVILNYGNEKNVKKLFELVGIKRVAEIFYRQTSQKRNNYYPQTINFFKLYFNKNA